MEIIGLKGLNTGITNSQGFNTVTIQSVLFLPLSFSS